ncbi:hypothetical protein KUTeg_007870 [Tegillarca granosa]|uniref:Uncharacterized protein n=1 Tax=Tegillarca granosa TaxID=220873 RepID=A0ABQ9FJ57_TEGGR|nr:hypothetical protein KUTeg_007870 [Tegillarca granosa]
MTYCRTTNVLSAKRKHLKTQGKGNKPYKADELTSEEIDMLYSSGCLGTGSPQSLEKNTWSTTSVIQKLVLESPQILGHLTPKCLLLKMCQKILCFDFDEFNLCTNLLILITCVK